jgi:uncharacterized protein involved in exopolysaccharide biosynthesis
MSFTLRELVAILFRQKRIAGILFGCSFGLCLVIFSMQPNVYDAEMKILVNQTRVDPVLTPDSQAPYRTIGALTEQDLSSEAELLKSRDILEGAVTECTTNRPKQTFWAAIPVVSVFAAEPSTKKPPVYDIVALSHAVRDLDQRIEAVASKSSNLISVTYSSTNPTGAACILKTVARLYMEKHLAMHRPGGAFEFFRQEADRYKSDLAGIERQLAQFGREQQLVTEGTEKEITVRKLGDYAASLVDTRTEIAATQARIRSLENLSNTTEPRQMKSIRTSPNAALKELQTQLVALELKRTDMRQKFNPAYRPLQDLDTQIDELKSTIAEVQKIPFVEETTDANPANDWLRVELAKSKSELASLQASAPAKEHAVKEYRSMALDMDQKNIKRAELVRLQKATEEKYLLYLRKQDDARIEQEMDRQRILNVAIAQDPTVPILPEPSLLSVKLSFAGLLAVMLSFGGAFGADYYDRTFRTGKEVRDYLGVPALASMPLIGDENPAATKGMFS